MVRQALEHVADVDHQRARRGRDFDPFAFAGAQFEARFLGPEQQGDEVDVLVGARADRAIGRAGHGRVVEQAQHRIAIGDGGHEPVGLKPQPDRDSRQDRGAHIVEGGKQRLERLAEALGCLGPDIGHGTGQGMSFGQVAPDVPEFLEVADQGALGDLGAERGIAARAADAGDRPAALFGLGQGEEPLRQLPGPRDQVGVEAMILDHGKAELPEAGADGLGKRGRIIGQREHGQRWKRL
jgi:hypothetical protein